jgi:prepilin-type N-terminal cleavage/methylation domain-containing protein
VPEELKHGSLQAPAIFFENRKIFTIQTVRVFMKSNLGFTLIELLVVIIIIGIRACDTTL